MSESSPQTLQKPCITYTQSEKGYTVKVTGPTPWVEEFTAIGFHKELKKAGDIAWKRWNIYKTFQSDPKDTIIFPLDIPYKGGET